MKVLKLWLDFMVRGYAFIDHCNNNYIIYYWIYSGTKTFEKTYKKGKANINEKIR